MRERIKKKVIAQIGFKVYEEEEQLIKDFKKKCIDEKMNVGQVIINLINNWVRGIK